MRKLIVVLILLDVGLAVLLVQALQQRWQAAPIASAAAPQETPSNVSAPTLMPSPAASRSVPSAHKKAPGIDWRLLAAPDLHACVAALRDAGCPASTIQDIIVAEVNRRFAPREQALKLRYEDYDLWDAPPQNTRHALETRGQLRELVNEKKALLKDLLGADVALELPKAFAARLSSSYDAVLSEFPEGKRDQVRSIQEDYLAKLEKLRARTLNYLETEDMAELLKLKQERRQALAQVLSPDELVDLDIKTSNLSKVMKSGLQGVQVSETEFRELFKHFQGTIDEAVLANAGQDPSTLMANIGKLQKDALNSDVVKNTLGDARYAELLKSQDPVYRRLQTTAKQAALPADSVGTVYELQKAAQQELAIQFANQNLSSEERKRIAQEVQVKTLNAVRQALGDDAFQRFEKAGGVSARDRAQVRAP